MCIYMYISIYIYLCIYMICIHVYMQSAYMHAYIFFILVHIRKRTIMQPMILQHCGVATISRLLKIIGLFCKRAL